MTTAAKIDDFYEWFKGIGGNMVNQSPEKLIANLHPVPLDRTSSLKLNPQYIKEKYNHKFKKNEPY